MMYFKQKQDLHTIWIQPKNLFGEVALEIHSENILTMDLSWSD